MVPLDHSISLSLYHLYGFRRTKEKDIFVIKTSKRPVPLEHFLYGDGELYKIVDEKNNWLSQGYVGVNNLNTAKSNE